MQNQISRRALAAGIALVPAAAALPGIAGARSQDTDPILAACAELQN